MAEARPAVAGELHLMARFLQVLPMADGYHLVLSFIHLNPNYCISFRVVKNSKIVFC